MKRKSYLTTENITCSKRTKILSDTDMGVLNGLMNLEPENRVHSLKTIIKFFFNNERRTAELLIYTQYQPIKWLIEEGDVKYLEYIITHIRPRNKFLIIAHDQFECLNFFVTHTLEEMENGHYNFKRTQSFLQIFLSINPTIIKEEIEKALVNMEKTKSDTLITQFRKDTNSLLKNEDLLLSSEENKMVGDTFTDRLSLQAKNSECGIGKNR